MHAGTLIRKQSVADDAAIRRRRRSRWYKRRQ
jgi:hypothetical protein